MFVQNLVRTIRKDTGCDRNDGNGPQPVDGLSFLITVLQQHFAPLSEETTLRAVSDFLGFAAKPHESVDDVIARFNMSRAKAQTISGFGMSSPGYAWMLLGALGCDPLCARSSVRMDNLVAVRRA